MANDPSDLIGAGRTPDACVNGLCNKAKQCQSTGYCLDSFPPDETTPERLEGDISSTGPDIATVIVPDFIDRWKITPLIGNKLLIGRPPLGPLTKYEAMLLSAWLCHEAGKLEGELEFGDVLNVVEAIDEK